MAGLKAAAANGNWSNPATWTGGTLPQTDDSVASNGFTVTIDQNITADSLTNSAQINTGIVPIMTSNTTPVGVAFSNNFSTGNEPYRAFDSPTAGQAYFSQSAPSVSVPIHLGYEFTSAKVVIKYSYTAHASSMLYSPIDFTFEGWDGTNWIILHTVVGHNAITYTSPTLSNTTAYLKYRINVTKTGGNNFQIYQLSFFDANSGTINAVQGGTFNLNSGVTVTCTGASGITGGPVACMTYAGTGSSTINANITPTSSDVNAPTLTHSGTGTLNLNGAITNNANSFNNRIQTVLFSGSGIFNVTGNITGLQIKTGLNITGTGTCNIIGNLSPANAGSAITVSGNAIVNITGTIFPGTSGSTFSGLLVIPAVSAVVTFTGNVFSDTNTSFTSNGIAVTGTSRLNVIGNVYAGSSTSFAGISGISNCYIDVIGTIKSNRGLPAFYSTGAGAIHVLSGPFISGDSGVPPFYLVRMHYRRTIGSYFEFRDNSTNGALPPAASAPATRLVAPSTVVDAPIPANVRFGTVYASGSQTGTMKVPVAANVRLGVAVDNTTGTAVLTAADIWNYLRANMNTSGSIGERLKNASTVDSTGTQIASTAP